MLQEHTVSAPIGTENSGLPEGQNQREPRASRALLGDLDVKWKIGPEAESLVMEIYRYFQTAPANVLLEYSALFQDTSVPSH
jgi:hypothetical protein